MLFTKWQEIAILAACICMLAMPGMATTVTVGPATIPAAGASVDVTVVADSFPNGLSGYIMTASVADPSVAEITGVVFPAWASFKLNSLVPAGEVSMRATDLSLGISPGAANVTLVTLTVRGKVAGATELGLSVRQMDPDGAGDPISPTVVPGTISVGGVVPTATVTTTATTTLPSPTVTTTSSTTTATVTTTATTAIPTPTATTTNATPTATSTTTTTTVTTTATTAIPTPTPTPQEPAYITVFSYPLGGSVALDGTTIGKTPLQEYPVEPGTHTLTATYPGYREYSTTLTVSPGEHKRLPLIIFTKGTPATFPTIAPTTTVTTTGTVTSPTATTAVPTATITGSTGTGALTVNTVPRGATIYIDDQARGVSPATISGIPAGVHELKVAKQNYKTNVKTVTVQSGKTTTLPLIVLSPLRTIVW